MDKDIYDFDVQRIQAYYQSTSEKKVSKKEALYLMARYFITTNDSFKVWYYHRGGREQFETEPR